MNRGTLVHILVRHSCGTLWVLVLREAPLLWDSCWKSLRDAVLGRSCRRPSSATHLWQTLVRLVSRTVVEHYRRTLRGTLLLHKSKCVKSPSRTLHTRCPPKLTHQVSRMSVSNETQTPSKNYTSSLEKEHFVRDFREK